MKVYQVLKYLKENGMRTKTGIMLGLGEKEADIVETMKDLVGVGLDVLTLGQYLQPTSKHLPVKEFVSPEQFTLYKQIGLDIGIQYVESGPLVRSSYKAEKHLK